MCFEHSTLGYISVILIFVLVAVEAAAVNCVRIVNVKLSFELLNAGFCNATALGFENAQMANAWAACRSGEKENDSFS